MIWIVVASISGTLAVVCGAFGAHGLRGLVPAESIASWQTAASYHLLHSVALLALGLFAVQAGRPVRWPAGLWTGGILLFSGSIYLLVLTGQRWLGPVTPVGGLLLVAGWASLLLLVRE